MFGHRHWNLSLEDPFVLYFYILVLVFSFFFLSSCHILPFPAVKMYFPLSLHLGSFSFVCPLNLLFRILFLSLSAWSRGSFHSTIA